MKKEKWLVNKITKVEVMKVSDDKKSINIMHISDIHCGIEKGGKQKYKLERKEVIESFYEYLEEIPEDWRPDIIAITGDLGWSGDEEDYKQFSKFLEDLLTKFELTVDDVICCPGNHDKYLPREQKFPKEIKKTRDYYSVNCVYDYMEIFAKDFAAYCNGLRQKEIPPLKNQSAIEGTEFLYGYRVIRGLCFVVLNSAWLCDWRKKDRNNGSLDRGNLTIDDNTVFEIINMNLPQFPVIVMYHHPKEWLREAEVWVSDDKPPTAIKRIEDMAAIILNGHMHVARCERNREHLHYVAGSISSNDITTSECVLLKVYVDQSNAKSIYVDEARYYSKWRGLEVVWEFEKKSQDLSDYIYDGQGNVKNSEETERIIRKLFEEYQKNFDLLSSEELDIMKKSSLEHLLYIVNKVLSEQKAEQLTSTTFIDFISGLAKALSKRANDDAEEKEHEKVLVKTPKE